MSLMFSTGSDRVVLRATRRARLRVTAGQTVREGELVANDGPAPPPGWHHQPLPVRWQRILPEIVGRGQFDDWVRLWFERQLVRLCHGLVHAPADLAAAAALGRAVDAELHWDLGPAMEYYSEAAGAFVFPPFVLPAWRRFRGVLPGEVAFDFSPANLRTRCGP